VSFPPPETRQINRAYIFGPDNNLKMITIKRKDIPYFVGDRSLWPCQMVFWEWL
jgi:hypothetical protein